MIDLTRPFRLRKMIVDPKTGNTYVPLTERHYLPGEVPPHLLNDGNCIQEILGDEPIVLVPEPLAKPINPEVVPPVTGFQVSPTTQVIEPSVEYKAETTETRNLHPNQPEPAPKKPTKA
jgi:hypothetical protein